jgi:hypothetical protein
MMGRSYKSSATDHVDNADLVHDLIGEGEAAEATIRYTSRAT